MSEPITPVVFRAWRDGDIIALFPTLPGNNRYSDSCDSYMHVGQHGAADYALVVSDTRPAQSDECRALMSELTSIGYVLKVMQRRPARA